jgi:phospholipase/carboxylesterase
MASGITGPHAGTQVLSKGQPLDKAKAAMIMMHGRGATAHDILSMADDLQHPDFAYLAPQAKGNAWYPNTFLAPIQSNEPWLSSAMSVIESLLAQVEEAGIPPERIFLLGFSQGASLTLEFVARHARRYDGVAGLSGGIIGPEGTPRDYPGTLDGTPIFLGCSDVDPYIPKARVLETERVLTNLGGNVTARLYHNMGHMVNTDEIDFVRGMMRTVDGGR